VAACGWAVPQTAEAAVKERFYRFQDAGAVAGQLPPLITAFNRRGTEDTAESTTDYGSVDAPDTMNFSFVPLIGSGNTTRIPVYANAEDRPGLQSGVGSGNLGLLFDGVDDTLYNPRPPSFATTPYPFDPRDFGQFDVLSQAWVKPTSAAFGTAQFVWRIGAENGGLAITADGKWALRTGNPSAEVPLADVETVSDVSVALNEWTHVAIFRGGNTSFLYIDGSIAAVDNGFWNDIVPDVRLGSDNNAGGSFFKGIVDNFSIGTASDGVFDLAADLDYYIDLELEFSDVEGDVDQDGVVDVDDYTIWSQNVGFNNGFGFGDPNTLLLGDVDQSGIVDMHDFQIINLAALNPPPPPPGSGGLAQGPAPEPGSLLLAIGGLALATLGGARCRRARTLRGLTSVVLLACLVIGTAGNANAAVVVADDFYYDGPTKLLHVGGGFGGFQQYRGGQNGPAGNWVGEWGQIGDGIITTPDYTPPIDPFDGMPEPIAPANVALYDGFFGVQSELFRDFQLAGTVSPTQTLYFGGKFRADLEIGTDNMTVPQFYAPRLFLNRVDGDDRLLDINGLPLEPQRDRTQDIALGFEGNMVVARLGADVDGNAVEVKTVVGSNAPDDGNWHQFVGKLELNVAGGANERLTVWIDPTGVETGGTSSVVEADILPDLTSLIGTFHSQGTIPLNPVNPEMGRSYIDDMVIGTAWQDIATVDVPRLKLRINRTDNTGTLINETSTAFQLNGYSIESEDGSLDTTGWNSLDEQNVGNWLQSPATVNQIVESSFMGSTTVAANGGQVPLGSLYNPAGDEDLTGRFTTLDGLVNLLEVEFVTLEGGLDGDYNNDGVVDAVDYTVWRNNLNDLTEADINNNGDGGGVGASDYTFWKQRYGNTSPGSGGGGITPVPEPASWLLGMMAGVAAVVVRSTSTFRIRRRLQD
jgi:hypothetical protein